MITGFGEDEATKLIGEFTFKSDADTEFSNKELDLSEFDESKFDCHCPRCGYLSSCFRAARFSTKRSDQVEVGRLTTTLRVDPAYL